MLLCSNYKLSLTSYPNFVTFEAHTTIETIGPQRKDMCNYLFRKFLVYNNFGHIFRLF